MQACEGNGTLNKYEQPPNYHPLLGCERCAKLTRHYFVRREPGTYQCVMERISISKIERSRLSEQERFNLLVYKCVNCGSERGYGNEDVE
jgi:CRISPR/Cas system-associated endoribonuclease Cas2